MTDTAVPDLPRMGITPARISPYRVGAALFSLGVIVTLILIGAKFLQVEPSTPVLVESTLGQLGLWLAQQSGTASPDAHLLTMRDLLLGIITLALVFTLVGLVGAFLRNGSSWPRRALLLALLGLDSLIFIVPVLPGDETAGLVQLAIALMLAALLLAPGKVTKTLGFMVVLSAIMLGWELLKFSAQANDYKIVIGQPGYTFSAAETIEQSLNALERREINALIVDKKTIETLLAADNTPLSEAAAMPHPGLRYLTRIETEPRQLGLPIIPALPRRSVVVVRAEDTERWPSISQLVGEPLGTVQGDFALDRFLNAPRQWQLIDLSIGNDLKLPHLQVIAEALFQPARRNGDSLLLGILLDAAQITLKKAVLGFVIGVILGFVLGAVFAHSGLLERGLLPYVIASQTIPILAVAPMVVIWLKDPLWSVAVIAAYLTFFPVTINTLRGLKSPHPNALELMRSYAASRWEIFWKLRVPSALPYIFTALKVSATASVVGTIIAELPSGIPDGLGRAILNFNQYYASGPEKLWATIFVAAAMGISFFLVIAMLELVLLPKSMRAG